MKPFSWSLLVGVITFVVTYVALMGFAIIRFSHYSGPLPDLLYAIPIPLFIALCAGAIAFRLKDLN
jgi:hypothetical protein